MTPTARRQDRRSVTQLLPIELNSLKPLNNLVLLKKMSDNRVGTLMGKEIRLDTKFNPEYYADVIYEVVATPRNLVYDNGRDEFGNYTETHGMEWSCRMDMLPGDIVWANYNQAINSLSLEIDGEMYQLMHYSHIYLSIRPWNPEPDNCVVHYDPNMVGYAVGQKAAIEQYEDTGIISVKKGYTPEIKKVEYKRHGTDKKINRVLPINKLPDNVMFRRDEHDDYDDISLWKVIMHNGYLLFTEIPHEDEDGVITLKENVDRFGVVQFAGRPNEEYREYQMWDDNRVRINDTIHLAYKFSKKLENNPLIARFGDGHKLHITQRHRILGVIPAKR